MTLRNGLLDIADVFEHVRFLRRAKTLGWKLNMPCIGCDVPTHWIELDDDGLCLACTGQEPWLPRRKR